MNILLSYPRFIISTVIVLCLYLQVGLFNYINQKNSYDIINVISNFCISFGIILYIFANFCIIYGKYLKSHGV